MENINVFLMENINQIGTTTLFSKVVVPIYIPPVVSALNL